MLATTRLIPTLGALLAARSPRGGFMHIARLAFAALATLASVASAQEETVALRCGRLIDGRSTTPLANATVVVQGGRVVAAGANPSVPNGAREVDLRTMTCLPGLIDLHTHLSNLDAETFSSADKAIEILKSAGIMLRSGFTTVRDVGIEDRYYSSVSVRNAIARGDFQGSRMFVAPHAISATGGHGDINTLAPDLDLQAATVVVDGADNLRKAIREEFKYGADWIKLTLTGGVMSAGDNPKVTTFTDEELAAAVDETHRHFKKITVHAIGTEGIKQAIRAGVDCIEHGILIDDEGIALIKAKGTWLVPTIYVLNYVIDEGPKVGYAQESIRKGQALRADRDVRIRAAIAAGVKIAFGSDNIFPPKDSAKEFAELVRLGLSPMRAIQAATARAAEVLGMERDLGTVEAGKIADIIAVATNPLDDIRVLEDVKFVMKDGHVITK
ncbi:MAG: amidohydrolase family protein [Gemmatimonadota bacterium]